MGATIIESSSMKTISREDVEGGLDSKVASLIGSVMRSKNFKVPDRKYFTSHHIVSEEAKERAKNYMSLKKSVVDRSVLDRCPICLKEMSCTCKELSYLHRDTK